jgi:hypothetical protein
MPNYPANFRRIHMKLAREPGHPAGASDIGYDFLAPLDRANRIDASAWREHRTLCRAIRFRPGETDDIGHLVRKPNGGWAFSYDVIGDEDDEEGVNFGEETFKVGEYVSIAEDDGTHVYRITSVNPA